MRFIAIIIDLLIVATAAVPLTNGATLNASINPKTNVANVNATSNFVMVLNYPNGSYISQMLSGNHRTISASASVSDSSFYTLDQAIDNSSNSSGPVPHVLNATIIYNYNAFANNTTLKVYRNLTLQMTITNILKKENGKYVIDMGWRSFRARGEIMADVNGQGLDVNELGDQFGMGFGMWGDFMPEKILSFSSLDFSIFNVPLSEWIQTPIFRNI